MILAAGRGERMRPLTDELPKPLLPVAGKPLIAWSIERLARAGFNDLVINHAHLGARIEDALGDGTAWGVRIRYSREDEALETAGGIAFALQLLGVAPFLVVNGDIYCEYDFLACEERARDIERGGDLAHLVLVPNPDHRPEGDFELAGRRVIERGGERLTFAGIGIYSRALFAGIAPGTKVKLAPLLIDAIRDGRVGGERFDGRWVDVGTPRRLLALQAELTGPAPHCALKSGNHVQPEH
jgi:MurNAc alpha-1-phosphate uridylyltransferase